MIRSLSVVLLFASFFWGAEARGGASRKLDALVGGKTQPTSAKASSCADRSASGSACAPTLAASQPTIKKQDKAASRPTKARSARSESSASVARYSETIFVDQSDDAKVVALIRLGEQVPSQLVLPLARGAKGPITARRGAKTLATRLQMVQGVPLLSIDTKGCAKGDRVKLHYRAIGLFSKAARKSAPHGVTIERYRFVNASRTRVDKYDFELVLPAGFIVHRVTKTIPAVNPKSPDIPYSFSGGKEGERRKVTMRCKGLSLGDVCAISYGRQPGRRSLMPLWLGLGLGLLYMWGFRSVLRQPEASA